MKKLITTILAITFLFSSCSFADNRNQKAPSESKSDKQNQEVKVIAAWIYYNEIEEFVKSSNTEDEFTQKVENAIDKLIEFSVNTVILHIRAFDDAFYTSKLFPVSKYCSDENGKLKFDVLSTFVSVCHKKCVKVWGWVNPYRINKFDDTSNIQKGYFQFEALNSENKELLIHSENGVYYNPADETVKKHIVDGIREILDSYDVDGIHFDDYFYPRTDKDFDKNYYAQYKKEGGNLKLNDFRRENVNSLILSVCSLTRKYGKVFSISPVSNIYTNVNKMYADVKLWATSDSYVDFIIPQIYFGFQNNVQPFEQTLKKWIDLTGDSDKLLIGMALYKSGTTESYSIDGKDEWKSRNVISKEIEYILSNYKNVGFAYYSASFLYSPGDEGISEEIGNIKNVLKQELPSSVT